MKWYKFLLLLPESWRNLIQCDDMILPDVIVQDSSKFALISLFLDEYDFTPRYYASPGHYASPGLEQQFNVGSSHDFFCLMFRIFILPPLFRVTSHHHHTLCMLDSICWTSIFFCISLSWFHFLKIDYKNCPHYWCSKSEVGMQLQLNHGFLFSLLQVFNQTKRNDF